MINDKYSQPPRDYIGNEAAHCEVRYYEIGGTIYPKSNCSQMLLDAIRVVLSLGHDVVSLIKSGKIDFSLSHPGKPQWHRVDDLDLYYKSIGTLASLKAIQLFLQYFNISFSVILDKKDMRNFASDRYLYVTPLNENP